MIDCSSNEIPTWLNSPFLLQPPAPDPPGQTPFYWQPSPNSMCFFLTRHFDLIIAGYLVISYFSLVLAACR